MKKEIHIWMGENYPNRYDLYITLESTERAICNSYRNRIDTTQSHVCSTKWLIKGYKIFVHMLDTQVVELKLGYVDGCDREIRIAHNLEKMLLSNCFGHATRSNDDVL